MWNYLLMSHLNVFIISDIKMRNKLPISTETENYFLSVSMPQGQTKNANLKKSYVLFYEKLYLMGNDLLSSYLAFKIPLKLNQDRKLQIHMFI